MGSAEKKPLVAVDVKSVPEITDVNCDRIEQTMNIVLAVCFEILHSDVILPVDVIAEFRALTAYGVIAV
jgi:hypothetical protein